MGEQELGQQLLSRPFGGDGLQLLRVSLSLPRALHPSAPGNLQEGWSKRWASAVQPRRLLRAAT